MATDGLKQFHDYADGILSKLSPSARKQLARDIALKLRTSNRKRITAQTQPDGSKFTPRKKIGRIKRKMFTKIRTTRYLKARSTPNMAIVSFADSAARIARVHHYGLRDRVDKNSSAMADYPTRELLGITANDWQLIEETTLNHLVK